MGTSAYSTSNTPRGTGTQDDPLGSRWNVRRTNATNHCGNLVLYRIELNHQQNYQLGCVQNVIERMQRREHGPIVGRSIHDRNWKLLSVDLHNFPLLEGMIIGGHLSRGGEPSHVVKPTQDRAQRGRHARR
ncbi:hypothetical protein H6P81_003388 [Aristolochia fimbriata]|uniref:Uncharacterized protein n=1 Tax=Aristolochia fimbriata TaxID=158543 RepID=A0AAV7FCG0_ARIFI|nr:hypothetical protein H6P81_003388 [Aristolochia fimbriata]